MSTNNFTDIFLVVKTIEREQCSSMIQRNEHEECLKQQPRMGQKSFAQPFHDSFAFDQGSSSSSSSMNQQILWNNMLFNPSEIQSMTDRLVSPRDSNNVANQDDTQLSIWGSSGSSSNQHYQQAAHDENKLENGWAPSATISSRSGPSIDENPFEGSRMLSFHNINSNHSATQIDGVQSFPQNNPWFSNLNQNTENAAPRVGVGNELTESRLSHHPYLFGFLDAESVSSLDLSIPGESYENVGLLREDDDRPESSIDGRRVSCKRKNSEVFPGQHAISGNASSSHQRENSLLQSHTHGHMTTLNISSSAMHPSVANSTEEYPTGFGSTIRGVASGCYPSATSMNAERSHRNYRMRTNPLLPHPNSWSANTFMQSDLWAPNQPPHSTSLNRSLEPTPVHATRSQNQTHLPAVPGQPQIVYYFPWSGASTSRISSSSGSFSSDDRMIAAREASHSRNMPVSSNLDLAPATRNMIHDQAHWNLGTRSASMVPNSHTGTNSGIHPTIGATWLHHQAPTQYLQPLAEAFHPSLYRSSNSETGGQATNFPLQHTGHSFISHDAAQQIRASLRGPHQTSHIRAGHLTRRRNDGLLGAPLTMRSLTAAGEERSRMLSEIRHALESLRRGDGLRFETLILAGSDLHDRHRDMRLDVDNMSYEELLALEERIGDVCTGLSEETIIKCIKQRKYSLMNAGPSTHQEPCCICQEEYVEDDDLGVLNCGHDFHTVCIKQWLMQKNLCPICKSTALMT